MRQTLRAGTYMREMGSLLPRAYGLSSRTLLRTCLKGEMAMVTKWNAEQKLQLVQTGIDCHGGLNPSDDRVNDSVIVEVTCGEWECS